MNKQSGNILFIILIAVALFAALSYAVSSMLRPNIKDASSEKIKIFRGQINDIETGINTAITRMIQAGCVLNNSSGVDGIVQNTMNPASVGYGALTRHDCNIFDTNGGAVMLTWDVASPTHIYMGNNKINFSSGIITNTYNLSNSYRYVMELAFTASTVPDYPIFKSICEVNNIAVGLAVPDTLNALDASIANVILNSQSACYIDGGNIIHYIFPVGPTFLGP